MYFFIPNLKYDRPTCTVRWKVEEIGEILGCGKSHPIYRTSIGREEVSDYRTFHPQIFPFLRKEAETLSAPAVKAISFPSRVKKLIKGRSLCVRGARLSVAKQRGGDSTSCVA
jgi:hypothetical protein